jgi:hypothetical protein
MSQDKDSMFRILFYETLAGPAGAASAFVGASTRPSTIEPRPVRLEADQKKFDRIKQLARKGSGKEAIPEIEDLGADDDAASSLVAALRKPAASGVISVMYCAGNMVQDTETYAVVTNGSDESWVFFPPASAQGPVVCEQTSVSSLTARILVAISTRLVLPL